MSENKLQQVDPSIKAFVDRERLRGHIKPEKPATAAPASVSQGVAAYVNKHLNNKSR